MMKNLILFFLFLSLNSFSQFEVPNADDLSKFFKSKTYVVLEDNPFLTYNVNIKNCFTKIWKLTPSDYLFLDKYESQKNDSKSSFFILEEVAFDGDNSGAKYQFICISLGGTYTAKDGLRDVFRFPLAYADVDEETYVWRLPVVVRIIQSYLNYVKVNPGLKKSDIKDKYFKPVSELKNKKLYLLSSDVESKISNQKSFATIYPYPFEFVTDDKLEEIIDNPEPNAVVLFKVGP